MKNRSNTRNGAYRIESIRAGKPQEGIPPERIINSRLQRVVEQTLNSLLTEYNPPAILAAVVREGRVAAAYACGVRKFGDTTPVTARDPVAVGSSAWVFNGTLAGRLVDKGILRWEMTLQEVFPELKSYPFIRREYLTATVLDLISYRSGLPGGMNYDELRKRIRTFPPTEARYRFMKEYALGLQAVPDRFTGDHHGGPSNVTFTAMCERASGKSLERLVRDEIFTPLKMEAGGFGEPDIRALVGPMGHKRDVDGRPKPVDFIWGTGTGYHCSVNDCAHLADVFELGLRGRSDYLHRQTFQKLTEADREGNAGAWRRPDHYLLRCAGSLGGEYLEIQADLKRRQGICVFTNLEEGSGNGTDIALAAIHRINTNS